MKPAADGSAARPAADATVASEELPEAPPEQEDSDNDDPSASCSIRAGSAVTVRSTGDPATVLGPGLGQYEGLVKIRYPDRSTYHVQEEDLELREQSETLGEPRRRTAQQRKPGSRLARCLSEKSPSLLAVADLFGLRAAAEQSGAQCFPWSSVAYRGQDKFMLHLASPGLLSLRSSSLRPVFWGQPLFARCESAADRERWGSVCPLRPCLEAAPLLAACASRSGSSCSPRPLRASSGLASRSPSSGCWRVPARSRGSRPARPRWRGERLWRRSPAWPWPRWASCAGRMACRR